ncbi:hypothetical protein J4E85_000286 [Alternaria conjuncta]|uniref:uncharacterized protein n=1 Tax=Alternaria triticimaculans TaxID=297637 RepID=UPI0020C3C4E8|nr:uncharacterized protein J4E78_000450 [Alternaria triticimaculans]XP_051331099.1 uncharacterized protein J4E85_000286 [Alternaria conjuncta]KAI4671952.1 hypothetical protein J4E78_000450 [Alternaria triticimaculans]KAI4937849.1 hypothetical protein J4E85_000286 [Alternaria conjuncta]
MDDVDTIIEILRKDNDADLPPELVLDTAATLSRNIFTHWHRLNAIVQRHEGAIRIRWRRKSPAKRRELLQVVYPGIPDLHRPDVDNMHGNFTDCPCGQPYHAATSSELRPYINSEDLLDAKSLLVFINARARNRPATFASSELSFSPMAVPCQAIRYQHVLINLSDQNSKTQEVKEEMYGRIRGFESETNAVSEDQAMHVLHHLGEGLQILRIQEGVLKFLVGCCENIMHDILPGTLCSDVYPPLSEPPSLSEPEELSSSLADACRKAPFGPRGEPNFARIRHLISTAVEKCEDHAWALREDPAYFAEYVQDHAEHRHENILNEAGEPSKRLGTSEFYSLILREILNKAYACLVFWDQLYRLSSEVEVLHTLSLRVEASEELIKRYSDSVEMLYYMLSLGSYDAAGLIRHFLMGAPQLRHLMMRYTIPAGCDNVLEGESDYRTTEVDSNDIIGQRVRKLLTRATAFTQVVDYSHLNLDCLETYFRREPSAKEKVSPFIEDYLNTLSVCVECLHQLRVSSCYVKLRNHFDCGRKGPLYAKWYLKFMQPLARWRKVLDDGGVIAPDLGNPSNGRFDYPSESVRTKQTVGARRKAERNLDKFWRYIDNAFRKRTGYSQHDTIRRLLDKGGPMLRTAPWIDSEDLDTASTPSPVYEYQATSEIFHDPTKEITGNFNRLDVTDRTKAKTHGEMTAIAQDADEDVLERSAAISKPLYHVGKDAYIVIKALFHVPNDSEPPGKVRWDQVVATLAKLGFAVEKLHGSAWQFTPKKLNLPRGIQFHEPHPSGEVPLTLARRYGRRLARAYGWEAAMFKQK